MRSVTVTSALATPQKENSSAQPPEPSSVAEREPSDWQAPSVRDIWRQPFPYLENARLTTFLVKFVRTLAKPQIIEIRGLEHINPDQDPFVLAANHSQRLEAVMLPSILTSHRQGKLVHFMADWPMMLVPFVALLYRHGKVIPVTTKSARPRWLNIFRPLFEQPVPAMDRAVDLLRSGASVGIFPEATMNRHPTLLLRGRTGASRLALTAGVPVVPVGIRFPEHDNSQPISDRARMTIEIGPPIRSKEAISAKPTSRQARDFHYRIMEELEKLSGKKWDPKAKRRRMHVSS